MIPPNNHQTPAPIDGNPIPDLADRIAMLEYAARILDHSPALIAEALQDTPLADYGQSWICYPIQGAYLWLTAVIELLYDTGDGACRD
jgi:hypothetical protein